MWLKTYIKRWCDSNSLNEFIMVVERGNFESVISTPNLRFGNKFSKKI